MPNVELTVGLPLYRTKYIAWTALESLCRQQLIDFDWELIVVEETMIDALPFGKDNIFSYKERLENVRCKNIVYIPLDKWVPLSLKWFMITDKASSTSICMLLQAGDCYSSPKRLKETFRLFKTKDADWVHSKFHVYYNIANEKIVITDHKRTGHPCGSDMAVKLPLLKEIKRTGKRSGVDAFLFSQCLSKKGKDFKVIYDDTDNWKYSINVYGLNNLSGRGSLMSSRPDSSNIVKHLIPKDILKRLIDSKKYLKGWKRI